MDTDFAGKSKVSHYELFEITIGWPVYAREYAMEKPFYPCPAVFTRGFLTNENGSSPCCLCGVHPFSIGAATMLPYSVQLPS